MLSAFAKNRCFCITINRFDLKYQILLKFPYVRNNKLSDLQVPADEAKLPSPIACQLRVVRGIHVLGESAYPARPVDCWFPTLQQKKGWGAGKLKVSLMAVLGYFLKNILCRHFVFPREKSVKFLEFYSFRVAGMNRKNEQNLWYK